MKQKDNTDYQYIKGASDLGGSFFNALLLNGDLGRVDKKQDDYTLKIFTETF